MNLLEDIRLAVTGLISNKMRALLTMLGIIIGIGSVIAITSVGNAMTASVNSSMSSFGVTNITVSLALRDDSAKKTAVSADDLFTSDMIAKYQKKYGENISAIGLSESAGTGKIKYRRVTNNVSVSGVSEGIAVTGNVELLKGRFISAKDNQRTNNVAVISEKLAANLFSANQDPLGSPIKVEMQNGFETFTIVGVYKEAAASTFVRKDNVKTTLYIPVATAKKLNKGQSGYQSFTVAATGGIDYTQFAQETQDYFDTYYVNNTKYKSQAMSMDSMISQVNTMMGTLSLAIAVIAGISLLVGGIGVMNIMLVSVTERTREIGIRKALGAPDSAIRSQFIIESMIICVIGGILGILVGAGLGYVGGLLLKQPAVPTLNSVIIAVGFSMAIGIFFGYYPANKAAKLDPIEALRYE